MRVAIQGEPGSNSHLAVRRLLGEQELVPCALSAEVFEALDNGLADAAVLPIENSLHGAVAEHYDLLLRHAVTIKAEFCLRIRHALIAASAIAIEDVREVLSHPVALSQCRRFFLTHPHCRAVPAYDTAGSVKMLFASGSATQAAVAAPYAAQIYGGVVLARDLEDDPRNFTRFLLLSPSSVERASASLPPVAKVSLAFAIPHQPGSLVGILGLLASRGADLTRIESRPVPGRPWEYVFFVDLRLAATAIDFVLEELGRHCRMLKELGRYAERGEETGDGAGQGASQA